MRILIPITILAVLAAVSLLIVWLNSRPKLRRQDVKQALADRDAARAQLKACKVDLQQIRSAIESEGIYDSPMAMRIDLILDPYKSWLDNQFQDLPRKEIG